MIFPLWICKTCGRYGGLGLSFAQTVARGAKGEKYQEGDSKRVECPECHTLMYEVQDNDRLAVISSTVDALPETLKSDE